MKHFYLKPFPIAFIFFLIPLLGQAQSNFKKGFVVSAPGDTLHGYINYQELGGKEPRTLAFKSGEAEQNIREFTPATSRFVALEDLVAYQSFQGRISQDAIKTNNLSMVMDTSTLVAQVYLKVVLQGPNVALYSYTDAIKTRYFLRKKQGPIQELGFRKYYITSGHNANRQIQTLKPFTGQLWLAALDLQLGTPALEKKIKQAQYTSRDLEEIVNLLNQVDPEQLPKQKKNTRFFAGLGAIQTSFGINGIHSLAVNTVSPASYSPKVSLGLDAFQNRHIQRLFYRAELVLYRVSANISGHDQDRLHDRTFRQTFQQTTLSLVPQVAYNLYNRENLKLNLGMGAAINFSAYSNNVYQELYTKKSDGTVASDEKLEDEFQFASFWYSIPVRAGVMLKQKTDISLQYFIPSPLTRQAYYSITQGSLQIGINHFFNRN